MNISHAEGVYIFLKLVTDVCLLAAQSKKEINAYIMNSNY